MINSVNIRVIPHEDQRYETLGDWIITDNHLDIFVSDCGNWVYNMAIALHELVEVLICHHRGITQAQVDSFDIQYEKDRIEANKGVDEEPGDDPKAPYHLEHGMASSVERMFLSATGHNWKEYEDTEFSLLK